MDSYNFSPDKAYNVIKEHWEKWAKKVGVDKWVVGISGGKDSTVVAALAARIFGKDNVYGLMMPNGRQADIQDSLEVCKHIGCKRGVFNIGVVNTEMIEELEENVLHFFNIKESSVDTRINMPARLRMTALYALAQSIDGIVLNTSNLSENVVGFSTLYGDHAGSYAPIQGLTVTEVIALGDWLGLPNHLVHKTPIDGLQPKSDEEKLGFKYADLDLYIREDKGTDDFKQKVDSLYRKNKFKTDIVQIPGPDFDYLGNFVRYHQLP